MNSSSDLVVIKGISRLWFFLF